MAYSFTEKKRIRKNFGKRPSILGTPYLLAIQLDRQQVWRAENARTLAKVLADALLFGERIGHMRITLVPVSRRVFARQLTGPQRPRLKSIQIKSAADGGRLSAATIELRISAIITT